MARSSVIKSKEALLRRKFEPPVRRLWHRTGKSVCERVAVGTQCLYVHM